MSNYSLYDNTDTSCENKIADITAILSLNYKSEHSAAHIHETTDAMRRAGHAMMDITVKGVAYQQIHEGNVVLLKPLDQDTPVYYTIESVNCHQSNEEKMLFEATLKR